MKLKAPKIEPKILAAAAVVLFIGVLILRRGGGGGGGGTATADGLLTPSAGAAVDPFTSGGTSIPDETVNNLFAGLSEIAALAYGLDSRLDAVADGSASAAEAAARSEAASARAEELARQAAEARGSLSVPPPVQPGTGPADLGPGHPPLAPGEAPNVNYQRPLYRPDGSLNPEHPDYVMESQRLANNQREAEARLAAETAASTQTNTFPARPVWRAEDPAWELILK